jgi:DNA-binding Lrp family transcriptional regulator
MIEDPHDYRTIIDERDLLIVRELQKNARATFADMAPILGISLQGVKYHFDKKLVPTGIVKHFGFDITLYPDDVSATHVAMLVFTNKPAMNQFYSVVGDLFFVQGLSKVLRNNALLIRTCVPQSQLGRMFDFYSELAKSRILQTYQTVRLNVAGEEVQTIDPELFKNEMGWTWNNRKITSALSKLR